MVQEHNTTSHHQQLPKYANGNVASTSVARTSKKNKPKKIPQRGLGVAQLEKLRIEEQKKMEGGAMSTTTPSPYMHPPPPLPPRPVVDGGMPCGILPMLWNSMDHTRYPYKRSPSSQPPVPMVSMGLSLTASSSHQTEPPSNQMYSCGSRSSMASSVEEERDTAGVKRSWPFLFEGMPAATFSSKAPPVPGAVRTMREFVLPDVSPDLSRYEFRSNHFSGSVNADYSDWRTEFAHSNSSKENGSAVDAAFLTLSTQPVPLIKQPQVMPSTRISEHGEFSFMPSQGSIIPPSPRPFYSFLPVGPVRCKRALNEWKTDTSDGVDLELKLWNS